MPDANFQKLPGVALVRGECIPKGCCHIVSDIVVQHTDGTFLLMRRSNTKTHGGMWECSAGGSALQGESALDCAICELYEETGIRKTDLTELGRIVCHHNHTIHYSYLVVTNCEKNAIVLQEGETQAYCWEHPVTIRSLPANELLATRAAVFIAELRR